MQQVLSNAAKGLVSLYFYGTLVFIYFPYLCNMLEPKINKHAPGHVVELNNAHIIEDLQCFIISHCKCILMLF